MNNRINIFDKSFIGNQFDSDDDLMEISNNINFPLQPPGNSFQMTGPDDEEEKFYSPIREIVTPILNPNEINLNTPPNEINLGTPPPQQQIPTFVAPVILRPVKEIKDPFLKNALQIQREFAFPWKGQKIPINFWSHVTGEHAAVGTIPTGQMELYQGTPNENILLKTYKTPVILAKYTHNITREDVQHAINQYETLKEKNFPVAEIYNLSDVKNNCGYFLVERIHDAFPMWDKEAKIEELTDLQKNILKQLKGLFQRAYEARIDVDFRPDNFRMKNDALKIIDFREVEVDPYTFDAEFVGMLDCFGEREGEIRNYLKPDHLGTVGREAREKAQRDSESKLSASSLSSLLESHQSSFHIHHEKTENKIKRVEKESKEFSTDSLMVSSKQDPSLIKRVKKG